ncbi:hypothetical protein A0H81_11827 [Grifola frondosa]|uniref:Calcineurin-like phosphoesterase domain-containing protein n=1 Tax=Grifola frondosa TaxID=5627 RepID=A0A1C7LW44_GRIFR|nr:hypothetical protein A0H81_11827 [Grifola frondosa]
MVVPQFLLDLSLKRGWHYASRLHPDMIIFLGDMLASWRRIKTDDEYELNYRKFKDMFHFNNSIPRYYLPGNNDVGLNADPLSARHVRNRYSTHFGPLNQRVSVRNNTFVLLDASGLAEEDYKRAAANKDFEFWTPIANGPIEFVKSLSDEEKIHPIILFTHIPLYRPDSASCGPLREKGTIRRGVGPGYQNTLGKKTSSFLLQTLRPSLLFRGALHSADDRDYCDYTHTFSHRPTAVEQSKSEANLNTFASTVREVTVKAFAQSSEIRRPGFHLLVATPPSPSVPSIADTPCFLPDYLGVYTTRYIPFMFFTVFVLLISKLRAFRAPTLPFSTRQPHSPYSPLPSRSGTLSYPQSPSSPIWTPMTPGFAIRMHTMPHVSKDSPRGNLPSTLRAPLTSRDRKDTSVPPTYYASTRPGTPLLPPMASPLLDCETNDEYDTCASPQYAMRRAVSPIRHPSDDSASEHMAEGATSYFLRSPLLVSDPPPSGRNQRERWSWSFVFGGRRRRVTIPALIPHPLRIRIDRDTRTSAARSSGRAIVMELGLDVLSVAWPSVLLWCVLAWWIS